MRKFLIIGLLGMFAFWGRLCEGQAVLGGTFNDGATNANAAADVFVPATVGIAKLTDLAVNSPTIGGLLVEVYPGKKAIRQTAANSTTTIYVPNTNEFAVGDFVIFRRGSTAPALNYELRSVSSIGTSTNIVVNAAPTTGQTSTNELYYVGAKIERFPLVQSVGTGTNLVSSMSFPSIVEMYFNGGVASCLRATNTTAANVKISISGVKYKP